MLVPPKPHITEGYKDKGHIVFEISTRGSDPRIGTLGSGRKSRQSRRPDPRHDLTGRFGVWRVGSGRVGLAGVQNLMAHVGSGQVRGFGNLTGRVGSGQWTLKISSDPIRPDPTREV